MRINISDLKKIVQLETKYELVYQIGGYEERKQFENKDTANLELERIHEEFCETREAELGRKLSPEEEREVFERLEAEIVEIELYPEITEEAVKSFSDEVGLTQEEKQLFLHNLHTNGKTSRRIIRAYTEGVLCEQDIQEALKSMRIAQKRHLHTDYDLVDKSNLDDEEVDELRREFNRNM